MGLTLDQLEAFMRIDFTDRPDELVVHRE